MVNLEFDNIVSLFSVLVTIVGFFITYSLLKKEYSFAILKEKNIKAADEMKETLDTSFQLLLLYINLHKYTIKETIDKKSFDRDKRNLSEYREKLTYSILKYGSLNSVKLWTHIEYNLISIGVGENDVPFVQHENNNHYIIATLMLLISQIKYDLYGLESSPEYILLSQFGGLTKTYGDFYKNIKNYNNELVDKLSLSDFLLINDDIEW